MNRYWPALGLMLLYFATAGAIDRQPAFEDPALQARYESIVTQLRCLVCQNETIADSNVDLAADLRSQVREMIKAGKSDDEIYKYMTDRYGDFVLFKPPVKPATWLLWAAPVLFVLIGVVSATVIIARKSKATIDESPDSEAGTA